MEESKIQNLMDWQERLVGLEFENPIINAKGETIYFVQMQKVFRDFEKRGWEAKRDYMLNYIDKIEKDFGQDRVSLMTDSGSGNLEMAQPPKQNIQEAQELYLKVRAEILEVLKNYGYTIAGYAIQPGHITDNQKFHRQNAMYLALEEMDSSDHYANFTSAPISAHQAGVSMKFDEVIDYTNEMIKIAGLIVVLCGNSPIHNWQILPWKEWRILIVGLFRFIGNIAGFEKLYGFPDRPFKSIADFLRYYWQSPWMILPLLRDGRWILPNEKINFIEYFEKEKVSAHDLNGDQIELIPSVGDLNLATICMWPHAKPHIVLDPKKTNVKDFMKNFDSDSLEEYLEGKLVNCYIECRAAGAAPVGEEMAIPALMLGMVNNLEAIKEITSLHKWEEWSDLVFEAAAKGFEAKIGGKSIIPYLQKIFEIALVGLKNRGFREEFYLQPMETRLKKRKNPADKALLLYKKSKEDFLKHILY